MRLIKFFVTNNFLFILAIHSSPSRWCSDKCATTETKNTIWTWYTIMRIMIWNFAQSIVFFLFFFLHFFFFWKSANWWFLSKYTIRTFFFYSPISFHIVFSFAGIYWIEQNKRMKDRKGKRQREWGREKTIAK